MRSTDAGEAGTVETGTTTVALTAGDAVVLAADRRASLGGRVVTNKRVSKIEAVHPTAAVTLSGPVGDLQAFVRSLRAELRLHETRRGEPPSMPATATLAGSMLRSGPYARAAPSLGGVDDDGPHVFDLDAGGSVLAADYVAGGSGMQVAYGVLESEYGDDIDAATGRQLAAEAVAAASERDTASGNGVAVATVTAEGVDTVEGAAGEVA